MVSILQAYEFYLYGTILDLVSKRDTVSNSVSVAAKLDFDIEVELALKGIV